MGTSDLPDIRILMMPDGAKQPRVSVDISGKSRVPMLQLLCDMHPTKL